MIFYHSDTVQPQPHSRPISLKTHHVNTTEEYWWLELGRDWYRLYFASLDLDHHHHQTPGFEAKLLPERHWYLFGSGSCMFAGSLWHVGGGICNVHSFLCHRKNLALLWFTHSSFLPLILPFTFASSPPAYSKFELPKFPILATYWPSNSHGPCRPRTFFPLYSSTVIFRSQLWIPLVVLSNGHPQQSGYHPW